jgi:AcrR family transcriptional regulator
MAADTRQRIKDEAMALFVGRGVDAVSVRDIAAAVGMKAPNLYAHFRSRDELVHELFAEGYAAYGAMLAEAAGGGGDFAAKLERMVRLICRLHDEETTRFRFLLITQHGSLSAIDPGGPVNPMELLQRTLQDAVDSGQIPPANAVLITAMIVGVVVQTATFLLYRRLAGTMQDHADALVQACQHIALRGQTGID